MRKLLVVTSLIISSLSFACESKDMAMKQFNDTGVKATLTILSDYMKNNKNKLKNLGSELNEFVQSDCEFVVATSHLIEHKESLSSEEKESVKKVLKDYYYIVDKYYNDLLK